MNFLLELLCIGSITALIHIKTIAHRAVPVFYSRRYRPIVMFTSRPLHTRKKKHLLGSVNSREIPGTVAYAEPNHDSTVLAINSKPLEVASRSKVLGDYFCRRTCENRINFVNQEAVWKSKTVLMWRNERRWRTNYIHYKRTQN